ncbi:MAG TPA: methyltransferase domain-containing protein [Actinoplanes sp.]
MTGTTAVDADRALKARHRAMWALGDYPAVVTEIVAELGDVLVDASDIRPGQRVLDVAAGTGSVAIPAARAGADVVASDLTPELLDVGRRETENAELAIEWREADAEALPFADAEFDRVLSCLGVMFAPHHQAGADELVRVCRPGGTIGLLSWTPPGFIGQMFAAMKPYLPPPPPGVQPPPLWGSAEHVRELLGDRVDEFQTQVRTLTVDRFGTPEAFRDYFKSHYGPTIVAYRGIADDPDRTAALDRDLVELGRRFDLGDGRMEWEYLVVTARRR